MEFHFFRDKKQFKAILFKKKKKILKMPMENYIIATNNSWKQLNTRYIYLHFHNQCYFFQYLHVKWYPISMIKFKKKN